MVSVILCPCILCVALLMDLFVLCDACFAVFVNCLGLVGILLLNVMEVFSVCGGALLHSNNNYGLPKKICVLYL